MSYQEIRNVHELVDIVRRGAYAWPGGYPLYFITCDGEALSFETVRENLGAVARAVRDRKRHGGYGFNGEWDVRYLQVNWEDTDLFCAHSGKIIESAYGE